MNPTVIHNFFSDKECDAAVDEAMSLKDQWSQCQHTNMYILGNSFLRNIEFNSKEQSYGEYFNTPHTNFKTAKLIKDKLSAEFTQKFSQPGFQIINRGESTLPSVWHYDDVILKFPLTNEFKTYDKFFVFTLMLSDGGYFDYYPSTYSTYGDTSNLCQDHINLIGDVCLNQNCKLNNYETIEYKKGSLLIQEFRFLHRVSKADIENLGNYRITMQSYGVVSDNVLYLFW